MENIEVMMFCKGDSIVFAGYECDFIKCNLVDKPAYAQQGYVDHPEELYREETNEDSNIEEDAPESVTEASDEEVEEQLLEALRVEAKGKKIKGWHMMGVDKLKEKLGYGD